MRCFGGEKEKICLDRISFDKWKRKKSFEDLTKIIILLNWVFFSVLFIHTRVQHTNLVYSFDFEVQYGTHKWHRQCERTKQKSREREKKGKKVVEFPFVIIFHFIFLVKIGHYFRWNVRIVYLYYIQHFDMQFLFDFKKQQQLFSSANL